MQAEADDQSLTQEPASNSHEVIQVFSQRLFSLFLDLSQLHSCGTGRFAHHFETRCISYFQGPTLVARLPPCWAFPETDAKEQSQTTMSHHVTPLAFPGREKSGDREGRCSQKGSRRQGQRCQQSCRSCHGNSCLQLFSQGHRRGRLSAKVLAVRFPFSFSAFQIFARLQNTAKMQRKQEKKQRLHTRRSRPP